MLIYLAAPWFNPKQAERHEAILKVLREWREVDPKNRQVYNPRESICPTVAAASVRRTFYDANTAALHASDIVVAITDERDLGTIFELGYAAALAERVKPIRLIGVALDLGGEPFNLMLAVACDAVCSTVDELRTVLFENQWKQYKGPIE